MECSKRKKGLKQHAIEKIVEDDSSEKTHAREGEWATQRHWIEETNAKGMVICCVLAL